MKAALQNLKQPVKANVSPEEYRLIQELRERNPAQQPIQEPTTFGDRLADRVADVVGSWHFILTQSSLLILWIVLNAIGSMQHWDPYPFILLNLMLSFQAAYTAPIIMMSQNRQSQTDRQEARHDYEVNLKSELEIELLHDKMNLLRGEEMQEVLQILRAQQDSELLRGLKLQQTQMDRLEQKLDAFLQSST